MHLAIEVPMSQLDQEKMNAITSGARVIRARAKELGITVDSMVYSQDEWSVDISTPDDFWEEAIGSTDDVLEHLTSFAEFYRIAV